MNLKSRLFPAVRTAAIALAGLIATATAAQAGAIANPISQLSATYYSVPNGIADFGNDPIKAIPNDVKSTLGPDGLPVNNANYQNVNGAGELQWWQNQYETGTGTVTLPEGPGDGVITTASSRPEHLDIVMAAGANAVTRAVVHATLSATTALNIPAYFDVYPTARA